MACCEACHTGALACFGGRRATQRDRGPAGACPHRVQSLLTKVIGTAVAGVVSVLLAEKVLGGLAAQWWNRGAAEALAASASPGSSAHSPRKWTQLV